MNEGEKGDKRWRKERMKQMFFFPFFVSELEDF